MTRSQPGAVDPNTPGPVVFCYDFPHRKTQMFLTRLTTLGIRPEAIVGAPRIHLTHQPRSVRTTLYDADLEHPEMLAKAINCPYIRHAHSAGLAQTVLKGLRCKIGLIAGARILPADVIACFSVGILNLHPSLLPGGTRGLDSWLWDLHCARPLGVTAHLIDARIDCGRLVATRRIEPRVDEWLPEIWFRLLSAQTSMLGEALSLVADAADPNRLPVLESTSPLPGPIPDHILREIAPKR
jgi:folate-dependent phosphoribosylglycinamide formyltransferase PurN